MDNRCLILHMLVTQTHACRVALVKAGTDPEQSHLFGIINNA